MPDFNIPATLNVLVFLDRSVGKWVAQCLEIDFAVEAPSLYTAPTLWRDTFVAAAVDALQRGEKPFAHFKGAPTWYAEQAKTALPLEERLSVVIPSDKLETSLPDAL